MARLGYMTASVVLLFAVVWTVEAKDPETESPDVRLRASPQVSIAAPGRARSILLTLEIVGPETEKYYCPEVVWLWPDGTRSAQESDCDPFEARTHYPRRYTRRVASRSMPRDYRVCAALRKDGQTFDKDCTRYHVR